MEGSLLLPRPSPSCRTQLKTKPLVGFSPLGNTQSFYWKTSHAAAVKITHRVSASSDFSGRRPRTKGSTPRGFMHRTQIPTSTHRRNRKKNEEENESPGASRLTKLEGSKTDIPGLRIESDEKDATLVSLAEQLEEIESLYEDKIGELKERGRDIEADYAMGSEDAETFVESEEMMARKGDVDPVFGQAIDENPVSVKSNEQSIDQPNTIQHAADSHTSPPTKSGTVETDRDSINDEKDDNFLKLELEREELLLKEAFIARLADEHLKKGNKLFHYPGPVKPDCDVEIYLNKSSTAMKNERDVIIMGAYNDWKWKSFASNLTKAPLDGDWWSCRLQVPKEAYKIDFVFYNGTDVYENNGGRDFSIAVEGGMSASGFESFLLEEKRREQEELEKQKVEKERRAEEQRQAEAERAAHEADRIRAREEASKQRTVLVEAIERAAGSVHDVNVWSIEPREFKSNETVRVYYNRGSGPLSHAREIWIHGGHNSWRDGLSIVSKLVKSQEVIGDWWYAEVVVPDRAFVLDWVFADGPPKKASIYDNNGHRDFHAIASKSMPDALYWVEEELYIFQRLKEERRLKEEELRAKTEKTALLKTKTKEKTLKTYLLSQKHTVYTDPLDVQAGSEITLYYNPATTVLNGKSEIWLRCSFNRWTHPVCRPTPRKMIVAENGSHFKATVEVPTDAYTMDIVFSDRENGGTFDNKRRMDYHIPISGGVVKEPPMNIVHVAVEMAPIAKVGGLGDVVTSLSRAVRDMNHNVDVILPKYDCLNFNHVNDLQFHKSYSWGGTEIKVWSGKVEGISVYFLEPQNGLFWAGCIYGRNNDAERFGFFCHAALEFLSQSDFHPDIIHCHDWSSAPVAWLFKEHYKHHRLSKARVVFTIHNLEFGAPLIEKAMRFSDKATTVSPTYAQEVSQNPAIAPHLNKFHGILNGIDPDIWDPYNDKFIPVPYTSENVLEGKRAAKEALQQRLGLKRADLPLVGIITRLTHQKGIHLIRHGIWRTLERNGQVVLLGSAPDPRIQNEFVNLANELHSSYNDRARLCLTYDEPLSHLIYAGADFIFVPSIFEPCGLTQLTAMRYGSIPVVRKTGGLYDTVFDVEHDKERARACGVETNGFSFDGADGAGVDYALNRAISGWYGARDWFNSLCKCVMEQDWSWNRPAMDYVELYQAARK